MSKRTESCKQLSAFTHAQFRTCLCCQGSWLSIAWHQRYSPELLEISVESLCKVLFFFFLTRPLNWLFFSSHGQMNSDESWTKPPRHTLDVWVTQTLTPDSSLCINGEDLRYERNVCQINHNVKMVSVTASQSHNWLYQFEVTLHTLYTLHLMKKMYIKTQHVRDYSCYVWL